MFFINFFHFFSNFFIESFELAWTCAESLIRSFSCSPVQRLYCFEVTDQTTVPPVNLYMAMDCKRKATAFGNPVFTPLDFKQGKDNHDINCMVFFLGSPGWKFHLNINGRLEDAFALNRVLLGFENLIR